jgi:hypothetical protein
VSVNLPQSTFEFLNPDMHIMVPEPISTAYFINPSHQPACLHVYPASFARQRLGKNVTAATNTHARMEECWTRRFVCYPCRIKGKQRMSSSQNFLLRISYLLHERYVLCALLPPRCV